MTYDAFKKAEKLLEEIQLLKSLIGDPNDRSDFLYSKFIKTVAEDSDIKVAVRKKISALEKEFNDL